VFSFVQIRDRNHWYKEIPQMICEFAYELPSLVEWTNHHQRRPEKEPEDDLDLSLVGKETDDLVL
jgi:hypothetical protein